ncbi:class I SAM-dependent methyltransferase [Nocardia sp. CNY236]|uniref:class I SAM-dependent methyltransferase n=1 Tax=Nocardia sp. CNY236 TaxID=1169152 RepID=UPI00040A8897|nr:class I SAM-dependent methyltransferase [Nocardia sp. CNY236]
MTSTPFTDPDTVAALYADAARTQQRTGALLTAKTGGDDATATIVDLAARHAQDRPRVCEIGCGRGTVTLALAEALAPSCQTVVDLSAAFLATVARRVAETGFAVNTVRGDFHHLPLPEAGCDVAVAAFCLYHSTRPADVVAEIARCLAPGGLAVLATKSVDSYHEIDHLMVDTGLDPHATTRSSLYATFHSGNSADIAATGLEVAEVIHRDHTFRFTDFYHLASYVVTVPKYVLPQQMTNPRDLAAELRRRTRDRPFTATSTVTYITGSSRP